MQHLNNTWRRACKVIFYYSTSRSYWKIRGSIFFYFSLRSRNMTIWGYFSISLYTVSQRLCSYIKILYLSFINFNLSVFFSPPSRYVVEFPIPKNKKCFKPNSNINHLHLWSKCTLITIPLILCNEIFHSHQLTKNTNQIPLRKCPDGGKAFFQDWEKNNCTNPYPFFKIALKNVFGITISHLYIL